MTAIPLEFDAVLKVDAGAVPGSVWIEDKQANGVAMAYRSFLTFGGQPLEVVAAVAPDMATPALLSALITLIDQLHPRCIAMCGVCAGRPGKVQLGDVVAAERLFYHDTGKHSREDGKPELIQQDLRTFNLRVDWKSELERMNAAKIFRGQSWLNDRPLSSEWRIARALRAIERGVTEPSHEVDETLKDGEWKAIADSLREKGWLEGVELTDTGRSEAKRLLFDYPGTPDLSPHGDVLPFKLHVAPMASGNKVVEDSEIWAFISESMRKTLGLDMEAAAVGAAAHYLRDKNLDFLVMKGVMDFANHGRDDHFKQFAARASAECLMWFLRQHLSAPSDTGLDDVLGDGTRPLPQGKDAPPSMLLQARHGVVPWHGAGRVDLLAELDAWADDAEIPVAAWLLHAEGGAGKTRLAIEWVRRRRERYDVAGFLAPSPRGLWLERLTSQTRPVIIVVDYAESRTELVLLLRHLEGPRTPPKVRPRIRVLLLARGDGDWWTELRKHNPELEPLFAAKATRNMGPLAASTADQQAVWEEAVRAFAAHRRVAVTAVAPVLLEEPRFSRVLYVHMAALLAVEHARKPADGDSRDPRGVPASTSSVLAEALDHEERYWASKSKDQWTGAHRSLALQMVVAATLRGGFHTLLEAGDILATLVKRPRTENDDQLLFLLAQIYRSGEQSSFLPGLEPDLLGEAMVLRLAAPSAKSIIDAGWIERAVAADGNDYAITTAFTVLGRASEGAPTLANPWIARLLNTNFEHRAVLALRAAKAVGARTACASLGMLLAEALQGAGSLTLASKLAAERIPRPSVALAGVAEWQTRTLLESAAVPNQDDFSAMEHRAIRAGQHSNDLHALGRRDAALAAAEEARRLFHTLALFDPTAFLPHLARSLGNISTMQSALGHRKAAVSSARESVNHFRTLNTERVGAFLPELAMSLNNLSIRQNELGRAKVALASAQESVDLYRKLAKDPADTFAPDLAMSLTSLGVMQHDLGILKAAFATTQEAVALYRKLAQECPDAFLPDLAMSLINLGTTQSELGDREAALDTAQEAVDLYRALEPHRSDAIRPQLAMSLLGLGNRQGDLGLHDEALTSTQKAVVLFRQLADNHPSAFHPNLAGCLNNLGIRQRDLGHREAALTSLQEAIRIYRTLANDNPDTFLRRLAESLHNLGTTQNELGHHETGEKNLQEAARIRNPLRDFDSRK